MRPFLRTISDTELDGGWLCLDFTNTIRSRFEDPVHEYLLGINEWLIWVKRQKLLDRPTQSELKQLAIEDPAAAAVSFKSIIKLREALHLVFQAIARGKRPPERSERYLNKSISFCFQHLMVEVRNNRKTREYFVLKKDRLLLPLLPVIKSAYELLRMDHLDRVKECNNCGWLFLDKSKNASRRWCNMQTCGSSNKAKRYYRKRKAEG